MKRNLSLFVCALLLFPSFALGNEITWGPVQSTTGNAVEDVADGGHVVLAINGQSQEPGSPLAPPESISLDGVEFTSASHEVFLGRSFVASGGAISFHGNTGNLSYDQFLAHVAVVDVDANVPNLEGTNDLAIYKIQGLTENTQYLVQIWYTDERTFTNGSRTRVATYGDNEPVPNKVDVPAVGEFGFGSFVVGTFVAGGTTQDLSFELRNTSPKVNDNGNPHVTGIMVREVAVPLVLLGDVDLNQTVDFFDIAPFIALLASDGFQIEADINQDGDVNFLDIAPLVTALSQ